MRIRYLSGAAFAAACLLSPAATYAAEAGACDLHVRPSDGVHSVGEDFDAVKRVDQDLRDYYRAAGRPLDWLNPERQLALLQEMPLRSLAGAGVDTVTLHPEPVSRREALQPRSSLFPQGCAIEVLLPQVLLERGGLAKRSLRIFGVVRRYENGSLASSYSGFSSAPMEGFQLKSPADAAGATSLVEQAFRGAVENLLRNAEKSRARPRAE